MKISKRQLKKIITESLFDDAIDYVSSMFGDDYAPGDVVSTGSEDPFEYKEQRGKWVYRKKDSNDGWGRVNRQGSDNLNKHFKKEPGVGQEDLPEDEKITDASGVYKGLIERNIIDDGDTLLLIDGANQKFYLKRSSSGTEMSGKVSTGKKGFGNNSGSGTTRAIVLSGMEDKNANVKSRNIYIHGTNREHKLGSRASGGCIRTSSKNIIKLADSEIKNGDYVYVFDGPASLTSTVTGKVGSLVDRGIEMFTEENKEKDIYENEDVKKVGGKTASDDEIAAILANYPPEENA